MCLFTGRLSGLFCQNLLKKTVFFGKRKICIYASRLIIIYRLFKRIIQTLWQKSSLDVALKAVCLLTGRVYTCYDCNKSENLSYLLIRTLSKCSNWITSNKDFCKFTQKRSCSCVLRMTNQRNGINTGKPGFVIYDKCSLKDQRLTQQTV